MFQTILISGGLRIDREMYVHKLLIANHAVPGYVFELKPEKASDSIKIEEVRELQTSLYLKPPRDITLFAVLYELHQATIPAQNSLLKLLEEPPEHVRVIITAGSEQRVLPTITSRCRVLTIENRPWHRPADEVSTYVKAFESLRMMDTGKRLSLSATISSDPEHVREWIQHMLIGVRFVFHQETEKGSRKNTAIILRKLSHALMTIEHTNTNQRLLIENLLLEI